MNPLGQVIPQLPINGFKNLHSSEERTTDNPLFTFTPQTSNGKREGGGTKEQTKGSVTFTRDARIPKNLQGQTIATITKILDEPGEALHYLKLFNENPELQDQFASIIGITDEDGHPITYAKSPEGQDTWYVSKPDGTQQDIGYNYGNYSTNSAKGEGKKVHITMLNAADMLQKTEGLTTGPISDRKIVGDRKASIDSLREKKDFLQRSLNPEPTERVEDSAFDYGTESPEILNPVFVHHQTAIPTHMPGVTPEEKKSIQDEISALETQINTYDALHPEDKSLGPTFSVLECHLHGHKPKNITRMLVGTSAETMTAAENITDHPTQLGSSSFNAATASLTSTVARIFKLSSKIQEAANQRDNFKLSAQSFQANILSNAAIAKDVWKAMDSMEKSMKASTFAPIGLSFLLIPTATASKDSQPLTTEQATGAKVIWIDPAHGIFEDEINNPKFSGYHQQLEEQYHAYRDNFFNTCQAVKDEIMEKYPDMALEIRHEQGQREHLGSAQLDQFQHELEHMNKAAQESEAESTASDSPPEPTGPTNTPD